MRNSTRLIVNTGAQYTRTLINLFLSLYSTRLILDALGIDDYGIFTLIAGVVSMLAFMTNAMVSTTQRFLSYHQTRSDLTTQQIIFGNSILMHLLFSVGVLILLEVIGLFLFDGFLNIPPSRVGAAKIIYQCAIVMILLSFITAPFRALLISHENLIYISVIDILDGVVKVGIAILLTILSGDKLVIYGWLMICIYLLNLGAFALYDFRKYKECVLPKLRNFNKSYLKSMSSFVGWQLYSTACIVGRTQGVAIVLNKFFGTVVNAAFGIALQISGSLNFISTALVTSINPQLVKAEGAGNRNKMFQLAEAASKFSFLLLAMVVIPVFFCLPDLLYKWLGKVPEGSVMFCRVILITALVDQITFGLGYANKAIGNIGCYSLTVNTIKALTVPILILLLFFKIPLNISIWCYAIIELICALVRLPFLKKTGGLNIRGFCNNVFLRVPIPIIFAVLVYLGLSQLDISFGYFIIICIPVSIGYLGLVIMFSLNMKEKESVIMLFRTYLRKIRPN